MMRAPYFGIIPDIQEYLVRISHSGETDSKRGSDGV
jgi:hypothetical protein